MVLTLQLVSKDTFWSYAYCRFRKNETLGGGKIKIFGFSLRVSCLWCDDFSILKQCRNGFIKWLMPALEAWWPQNLRLLSKLPTGKLKLFLQDSNAEKSKPVNKQSNT